MKKIKKKVTLLEWFMNSVHRAIILSVCFSMVVTGFSVGLSHQILNANAQEEDIVYNTKYNKIPINQITGEGGNPYEITGAASSLGAQKMWYEYIRYSNDPVGITQLNADQRIIYFDPYYYDEALVMSVQGAEGGALAEFTTANEISFSYTQESTMHMSYVDSSEIVTYIGIEKSSESNSSTTNSTSEDITNGWTKGTNTETGTEIGTTTENGTETGTTTDIGTSSTSDFSWGLDERLTTDVSTTIGASATVGTTVGASAGGEVPAGIGKVTFDTYAETTASATVSSELTTSLGAELGSHQDWSNSNTISENKTSYNLKNSSTALSSLISSNTININETNGGTTKSNGKDVTIGGSQSISEKLENSTGFIHQTDSGWSTSNSSTITTTYNATYFNSKGSPLPWRLVNYAVFMPMRYELQYRTGDDDWTTVATSYCLLTTMQGVCRNWMDNNNSYIEGWGTGEPQEWSEFWSQFFTANQLEEAYKNKLYPSDELE